MPFEPNFHPSPDVAAILHALLDAYERRTTSSPVPQRAVRYPITGATLPGYHSQLDPVPRQVANEQLQALERAGLLKLEWLPGESGHLLAAATLVPDRAGAIFRLLNRTAQAVQRARLADRLLGERFRFDDWRLTAIQRCLERLRAGKSPAPFSLTDDDFDRDVLTALAAFDQIKEETPYRVFSVRAFNDSKRFEDLIGALCALARRGQADWKGWSNDEILRELNLAANPTHLYLYGPWQLVGEAGQTLALGEFYPSVGLPAAQAHHLRRVGVEARRVICVENPTSFYELIRNTPYAALCLWGNPSPACRRLLSRLVADLPSDASVLVWADIDYGGLNILAQLREQISPRFMPYRMDIGTLEAHAAWARPLTPGDARHLTRLAVRPSLVDMRPLIDHMLRRGLKLEQEAIVMD